MDTVTKVLIDAIGDLGYQIDIGVDDDKQYTVTAVAHKGRERFIVRGSNLRETVIELAAQIGMDLEDV